MSPRSITVDQHFIPQLSYFLRRHDGVDPLLTFSSDLIPNLFSTLLSVIVTFDVRLVQSVILPKSLYFIPA